MKSSAKKIELASVDDLFSTEEGRQDAKLEKIQEIPLSELHPFKNHPFKVKDDEAMMETADSIKQYGVLVPAIARPDPEGGYELVAGHRRHRASELAEKETMPVIVRDLDDDAATIIMVDSNLQRESLLPSERAFAYKMKLDAIKHQGARTDLTSAQVGPKLTAAEKIAENSPDSKSQIKRFIRLTELIPELMDMVDEKKIALNPAYELSFVGAFHAHIVLFCFPDLFVELARDQMDRSFLDPLRNFGGWLFLVLKGQLRGLFSGIRVNDRLPDLFLWDIGLRLICSSRSFLRFTDRLFQCRVRPFLISKAQARFLIQTILPA